VAVFFAVSTYAIMSAEKARKKRADNELSAKRKFLNFEEV